MHICRRLEELASLQGPLHLALGVFDGVHLGHQAVIARAFEAARQQGGMAGLLTFDPHPIEVMAPAKAPSCLLATLTHKEHIIEDLGLELFAPLTFDASMAAMEAERFVECLMQANVRTLAVGEDWRFGHQRRGDVDMLAGLAARYGYRLEAVAPVMFDGERISSSRIRQAIRDGNLSAAAAMLGRPYSLRGEVVAGKRLGRELGFPTANIEVGRRQLPPSGVWAVRVSIGGERIWRPAVANLGTRPSVGGSEILLEVHLLDYAGDLYGRELELRFIRQLREERSFPDLHALRDQIARDAANARCVLAGD